MAKGTPIFYKEGDYNFSFITSGTVKTNKKAATNEFTWTKKYKDKHGKNQTKTMKGKWQLRVKYIITSDNIQIFPYIVVTGDGFKSSEDITVEYSYKKLKRKTLNAINFKDDWTTHTESKKAGNVKGKGTYYVYSNFHTLNTFEVTIIAKRKGVTSKTTIQSDIKPPKPEPVYGLNSGYSEQGLYHKTSDPYDWEIRFKYDPKGKTDYAVPIDQWYIDRLDSLSSNWTQIKSKYTNHDVDGFTDYYPDRLEDAPTGKRFKWRITFVNSAGTNSLILPINTENSTVKNAKGKPVAIKQSDTFKEWGYTPPPSVDIANIARTNSGATIQWNRDIGLVNTGIIRGYFVQYQKNKGIGDTKNWYYCTTGDKINGKDLYVIYEENADNISDASSIVRLTIPCEQNARYRFRLVPFNFDYGVVPERDFSNNTTGTSVGIIANGVMSSSTPTPVSAPQVKSISKFKKLSPTTRNVQVAGPSSATEQVYFKPAAPDSVTGVKNATDNIDVTIKYQTASGGSANSIRIHRRYHFTDGTEGPWAYCEIEGQQMTDEGVSLSELRNPDENTCIFEDMQGLMPPVGKVIEGVSYKAELGAVYDVDQTNPMAPTGEGRWSTSTIMTGYVTVLTKPNPPGLLFPEKDKIYPETTEEIYMSWVHNPTDNTDQTAATVNIFVFDKNVDIPSDFLTVYAPNAPNVTKNQVSIADDTSYYYLQTATHITKITDLNTVNHTISGYSTDASFSADDVIVWQAQTKGTFATPSDFSTEYKPFKICGVPRIDLDIPELTAEGTINTLPVNITWNYQDQSGTISALTLYLYQGSTVVESYDVDLETYPDRYPFMYLFDNNESYSIVGEAVSTTSLVASESVEFTVEYIEVQLRNQLRVGATFDDSTGWAVISLLEESNDGTQDDAVDVISNTTKELFYYLNYIMPKYIPDESNPLEPTEQTLPNIRLPLKYDSITKVSLNYTVTSMAEESNPSESSPAEPTTEVFVLDLLESETSYSDTNVSAKYTISEDGLNMTVLATLINVTDGIEFNSATITYIPIESATGVQVYFNYEYDEDENNLVVKAFLDKPIEGLTIAATLTNIDHLFPNTSIYPSNSIYPLAALFTDDQHTNYRVYDGYPDELANIVYLHFITDGDLEYEEGGHQEVSQHVVVTINFKGEHAGEMDIPSPIKAIIYNDIDEEDATSSQSQYIDEDATEAYLYRYYRGEKTFIGHFTPNFEDEESVSASILDRFCPINRDFQYQLIQLTGQEGGERHISYSESTFNFDSLYWYSYWGPSYDNVAKARWNPNGSASYSRPEQQSVRYSGRRYPVIYDSDAVEETYSFNVDLYEDDYMQDYMDDDETAWETIELYRQLMLDGGVGFWKSFDGDVYFASFTFSYTVDYTDGIAKYPCSLNVTRIEGDEVF